MSLLSLKKVSLGYGDNTVISGADFAIESGDFICIVGANGSGKSTLVRGILGLIKPLKGEIIFG